MNKDNDAFWKMVAFCGFLGFFTSVDYQWVLNNPTVEEIKTRVIVFFVILFVGMLIYNDTVEETYKKDGDNSNN